MNKQSIHLIKLVVMAAVLFAGLRSFAGGDLVNNGGGIAEKNVIFAYQRLESYLRLCLTSELCRIDKTQKEILEQIINGMPQERQNTNQIQFVSEKRNPGFFIIDGEVKVAKTGSRVGSSIFVNTDLLYTKNEMGYFIPITLSEAAAILVHELGHHYGNYSHTDLDLLGVRVAMLLNHRTYSTPLLPWTQQISATVINPNLDESFPDILLYIEDQVVDISEKYKAIASCPKFTIPIPILPLPDIPVAGKTPAGSLVHNVYWKKMTAAGDKAVLSINADISHKCKRSKDENVRSQDFRLEIDFSLSKDANGKWTLDPNSVLLEQKKDAWWKIIKFSLRN
jgi:hypothetical protein